MAKVLQDCVVLDKVGNGKARQELVHLACFLEHGLGTDPWVIDARPVYYAGQSRRKCKVCRERFVVEAKD